MSLEQNKAIIRQFYKVVNQGNLEQAKEMLAQNIVVHPMKGSVIHGADHFLEHLQIARSSFPDVYYTIEEVIAEADKVVSHGTFTGTHSNEFLGILPTGRRVIFSIVQVDQLADGKLIEHRTVGDSLTMLQQLRGENLI